MPLTDVRKCEVCTEPVATNGSYCQLHETAHSMVLDGYLKWKRAFVSISWERYLESILELSETGDSSKQIAERLLYPK